MVAAAVPRYGVKADGADGMTWTFHDFSLGGAWEGKTCTDGVLFAPWTPECMDVKVSPGRPGINSHNL